jgi:hypothetical protein
MPGRNGIVTNNKPFQVESLLFSAMYRLPRYPKNETLAVICTPSIRVRTDNLTDSHTLNTCHELCENLRVIIVITLALLSSTLYTLPPPFVINLCSIILHLRPRITSWLFTLVNRTGKWKFIRMMFRVECRSREGPTLFHTTLCCHIIPVLYLTSGML